MNLSDILRYGHGTVMTAVDGLRDDRWNTAGACGQWSVKDIVAHLASFELALVDVLTSFTGGGPTPHLDAFRGGGSFNDTEVAKRRPRSATEVLAEYAGAHARAMTLAARIPAEQCREAGRLPWYGVEYSLDDFVVYTNYGHKREHCAQIKLHRKRLEAAQ